MHANVSCWCSFFDTITAGMLRITFQCTEFYCFLNRIHGFNVQYKILQHKIEHKYISNDTYFIFPFCVRFRLLFLPWTCNFHLTINGLYVHKKHLKFVNIKNFTNPTTKEIRRNFISTRPSEFSGVYSTLKSTSKYFQSTKSFTETDICNQFHCITGLEIRQLCDTRRNHGSELRSDK